MEPLLGESNATLSVESVRAKVVAEACKRYAGRGVRTDVEAAANRAVDELLSEGVRVTAFIPVLALRKVREELGERTTRSVPA